jgi:hypothetical protein
VKAFASFSRFFIFLFLQRGVASDEDRVEQETMKPGKRPIFSWLHGFLLNHPQVKNLTCSQHVSSVQDSSGFRAEETIVSKG